MTTEILLAIIAIFSAPTSAWVTAKMLKAKYAAEVEKLRAEVAQMKSLVKQTEADTRGQELENDKTAINMIVDLVAVPLRKEMKLMQSKLTLLTNAIEKIYLCPYSDKCPVTSELQRSTKDNGEPDSTVGANEPTAGATAVAK